MNTPTDCDERLNAFVDGEAGAAEREEVFAAMAADPSLARRVDELRRVKSLVGHAYGEVPAPRRRRPPARSPWRAAALALFVAGVATGWIASQWRGAAGRDARPAAGTLARAPGVVPGLVIQVADHDVAKWRLAIDQAAAAIDPRWRRGTLDVVIVAYGPGLAMLRGGSAAREAIAAARARGIRFVACGNTMANEHVAARELLPGIAVAEEGATLEILALERAGYAYVRI